MPMSFNKKDITEAQHSNDDATLEVDIDFGIFTSDVVIAEVNKKTNRQLLDSKRRVRVQSMEHSSQN